MNREAGDLVGPVRQSSICDFALASRLACVTIRYSLGKGEIRLDPRHVGLIDEAGFAELAFALGVFRRQQMPA